MKKILLSAVGITLVIVINIACSEEQTAKSASGIVNASSTAIPVTWYSGYKMPELLEESVTVSGISDIRLLSNKKWYSAFTLTNPAVSTVEFTLDTCADALKHAGDQLETIPARDNSAFHEMQVMCSATKIIADAKPSKQTFWQKLIFDNKLPGMLPAQLAMVISETESLKISNDKKIKFWSQVNNISGVETIDPMHVTYKHEGGSQEIELVAKGDFNGDGIEDMLLTSRDSVEGGSYTAIRLFALTKLSEDAEVTMLNL